MLYFSIKNDFFSKTFPIMTWIWIVWILSIGLEVFENWYRVIRLDCDLFHINRNWCDTCIYIWWPVVLEYFTFFSFWVCYMNKININSMLRTFLSTIWETYAGLGLSGRLLVGWCTSEIIFLAVSGTYERQYHRIITGWAHVLIQMWAIVLMQW